MLGLIANLTAPVQAIPQVVRGGAGLVMFPLLAATGGRMRTHVDFKTNRRDLFVVALSIEFGVIAHGAPTVLRR